MQKLGGASLIDLGPSVSAAMALTHDKSDGERDQPTGSTRFRRGFHFAQQSSETSNGRVHGVTKTNAEKGPGSHSRPRGLERRYSMSVMTLLVTAVTWLTCSAMLTELPIKSRSLTRESQHWGCTSREKLLDSSCD